jgi:hypothetical protein
MVAKGIIRNDIIKIYKSHKHLFKNIEEELLNKKILDDILIVLEKETVSRGKFEKNKKCVERLYKENYDLKKELSIYRCSMKCLKINLQNTLDEKKDD